MSEISRGVKSVRPAWDHATKNMFNGLGDYQLEMLESCRNVMEQVRDEMKKLNSLLHCQNFIAIPRKLDAIKRNTARKRRAVRK